MVLARVPVSLNANEGLLIGSPECWCPFYPSVLWTFVIPTRSLVGVLGSLIIFRTEHLGDTVAAPHVAWWPGQQGTLVHIKQDPFAMRLLSEGNVAGHCARWANFHETLGHTNPKMFYRRWLRLVEHGNLPRLGCPKNSGGLNWIYRRLGWNPTECGRPDG